jgi:tellurite resistance protein TehA-like permease
MGLFISLLMWSFGLIWLVFALATIYHASPFPFNMGWWGFTFPLGVYAANTLLLGEQLDLMFFKVFGMVSIYHRQKTSYTKLDRYSVRPSSSCGWL